MESQEAFFDKLTQSFSYFLISLMMGCVGISFVQLANRIAPTWRGDYVIILVVAISIERILTRNLAQSLEADQKAIYHLAEWITISVGLKLLQNALTGFTGFLGEIQTWQADFLHFFEGEYTPVLLLLFLTWWFSGAFASDLDELQVEPLDVRWEIGILENRRRETREAMITRIVWIGLLMVVVSLLTRLDFTIIFGVLLPFQAPVINVLIYFFAALLLFGITQFSLLRGRWLWHQVAVPTHFRSTWVKYGAFFLLALTITAFLLPTGYTFEFLRIIQIVIAFLSQLVVFFWTALMLPLGWLISLLKGSGSSEEPLSPPAFSQILPQASQAPPDPLFVFLQTILFWILLFVIIAFSITTYFKQSVPLIGKFNASKLIFWFNKVISALFSWFRGGYQIANDLVGMVKSRLMRAPTIFPHPQKNRYPNFRTLTPRQQVIFFYNRLLERTGKSGIPRKPFQTPAQFSQVMRDRIPQATSEIDEMTDQFDEARYSIHPISEASGSKMQRLWNHIARSLRSTKPNQ